MLARLLRTPARRRTIWLIWAALIAATAVSYISENQIRDQRGEFAEYGDYADVLRSRVALFLAGLVLFGIPITAIVNSFCLKRHTSSVGLFEFDQSRFAQSLLSSIAAAYLCYCAIAGMLKADREIWFVIPVEMAQIWFLLILRAALVAPRDQS